jgi:hypothetical protein
VKELWRVATAIYKETLPAKLVPSNGPKLSLLSGYFLRNRRRYGWRVDELGFEKKPVEHTKLRPPFDFAQAMKEPKL